MGVSIDHIPNGAAATGRPWESDDSSRGTTGSYGTQPPPAPPPARPPVAPDAAGVRDPAAPAARS